MENKQDEINNIVEIIKKYIKKDKINHAYLLETNTEYRIDIAEELIKNIFIDYNDNINNLKLNYDIQILKTNNQFIKKEEILELKEKYMTKSIYNSKRVYIIEEAEKLTSSSANTLLKFLEEPEENIIAILITNNKNKVISTIVSRCQIIRAFIKKNNYRLDEEYFNSVLSFALSIDEKKEQTLAYINNFNLKDLTDRNNLIEFLNNLLYIYSDALHLKLGLETNYFDESFVNSINLISEHNDIYSLKTKINAINECINRAKYNTNIRLLVDKLIILMSGVDI